MAFVLPIPLVYCDAALPGPRVEHRAQPARLEPRDHPGDQGEVHAADDSGILLRKLVKRAVPEADGAVPALERREAVLPQHGLQGGAGILLTGGPGPAAGPELGTQLARGITERGLAPAAVIGADRLD
jgi:hypothetical protein